MVVPTVSCMTSRSKFPSLQLLKNKCIKYNGIKLGQDVSNQNSHIVISNWVQNYLMIYNYDA
jgi:hypothetical protein